MNLNLSQAQQGTGEYRHVSNVHRQFRRSNGSGSRPLSSLVVQSGLSRIKEANCSQLIRSFRQERWKSPLRGSRPVRRGSESLLTLDYVQL